VAFDLTNLKATVFGSNDTTDAAHMAAPRFADIRLIQDDA
jgi:hypothetical protein